MKNFDINMLGWNNSWQREFEENYQGDFCGRITEEHRGIYRVAAAKGIMLAKVSGKLGFYAEGREDYPAVGDWVALDRDSDSSGEAIIKGILKRKSSFSRKAAGGTSEEQIIASNIDILFITMSLNQNYNLRRLERYISLAWDSGATPMVLLTKADLCEDLGERLEEVYKVAIGVEVIIVSAVQGLGIQEVRERIPGGITAAFVGSSGVGKSTLINAILGEEKQAVSEIREEDARGRHTTTHRELILIPEGGVVIDTPGMRELQLLDGVDGVNSSFQEIEELAKGCKFSDCTHNGEPGCAVTHAIEEGILSYERLQSYVKLKKEAEFMERKLNRKARMEYKKEIVKLNKSHRHQKSNY